MPLDPSVQALLAFIRDAGRPKTWQLEPAEAREGSVALARFAAANDVPIGSVQDGSFPGPGGAVAYRSYTPLGASPAARPGLIWLHGGGYVIGNFETHEGVCRLLANASGAQVIAVDYRMGPEHRFPAAVEDGVAAVHWVSGHAVQLGIDAARIAVGGDSAGGGLAAAVCQLLRAPGAPRLALQILFCPWLDMTADTPSLQAYAENHLLERNMLRWAMRHYGADPLDVRASPGLAKDLSGLPPTLLHTAEFDPLRDEGAAYAQRLQQAGVHVKHTCHSGMVHHFYALAGAIPYGRTMLAEVGREMRAVLGSPAPGV